METQTLVKFEEALDVNRASAEDLRRLPGIGRTLAARIVMSRDANGPFDDVDELLRVRGVTPKVIERIAEWIVVDGASTRPRSAPAPRRLALVEEAHRDREPHVEEAEMTLPSRAAPQLYAVPRPREAPEPENDSGHRPTPLSASLVLARPEAQRADEGTRAPDESSKRVIAPAETVAAASVAVPPEGPGHAAPRALPAAAPQKRPWLAGVVVLCLVAAAAGGVYAELPQGYASKGEVNAQVEKLSGEIDAVKIEQRKANDRVDLLAEVAAELPGTVETLHANAEAQQKEVAAAQATAQKLTKDVATLRDSVRRSERDADRRLYEMRLELESAHRLRASLPPHD